MDAFLIALRHVLKPVTKQPNDGPARIAKVASVEAIDLRHALA